MMNQLRSRLQFWMPVAGVACLLGGWNLLASPQPSVARSKVFTTQLFDVPLESSVDNLSQSPTSTPTADAQNRPLATLASQYLASQSGTPSASSLDAHQYSPKQSPEAAPGNHAGEISDGEISNGEISNGEISDGEISDGEISETEPNSDGVETGDRPPKVPVNPPLAPLGNTDVLLQIEGVLEAGDQVLSADNSLYDEHPFEGRAGQPIIITLESDDFDTYLVLVSPDQRLLSESDDVSEQNSNSSVTTILPVDGTYRAIANAFDSTGQGAYTLTIREIVRSPRSQAEPTLP